MSCAETITNSFHAMPSPKLILLIFARETLLRTVAPCNMPGKDMSSMYRALPVTLSRPSLRGTGVPIMVSGFTRTPGQSAPQETLRRKTRSGLGDKFSSLLLSVFLRDMERRHGADADGLSLP